MEPRTDLRPHSRRSLNSGHSQRWLHSQHSPATATGAAIAGHWRPDGFHGRFSRPYVVIEARDLTQLDYQISRCRLRAATRLHESFRMPWSSLRAYWLASDSLTPGRFEDIMSSNC